MDNVQVRLAEDSDIDSILRIFLDQFPFLKECEEKARKDIVLRVVADSSVTVVAVIEDKVVGVARGQENKGIYLMDSICTVPSSSLVFRSKVVFSMLPFYVNTCIAHAVELGLGAMFYGTDMRSLARIGPVLCKLHGYRLTHGEHDQRQGFWITKECADCVDSGYDTDEYF